MNVTGKMLVLFTLKGTVNYREKLMKNQKIVLKIQTITFHTFAT